MADALAELREALAAVRREHRRAAAVVAVVDAAVTIVLVGTALVLVGGVFAREIGPVGLGTLVGLLAGVCVGAGSYYRRRRQPAIEAFEAANPALRERLRTARDAAERGTDGQVARRLYADVLERLRESSSSGLLPRRRLAATLAIVAVLGGAGLGLQVIGIEFMGTDDVIFSGGFAWSDPAEDTAVDYDPVDTGIRPGEEILGGSTNYTLGDENISAIVDRFNTGGEGENESSGGELEDDGPTPIQPQSAGYSPTEPVEEAELIRAYTLAMEAQETSDAGDDQETQT